MTPTAIIHRGAQEVGGSCVEIKYDGQRLVLDIGRPLDGADAPVPPIPGLIDGKDPTLRAVIVSHGHADHHGLAESISPTVPLIMGEATERILKEAAFFSRGGFSPRASAHLRDGVPLHLGPFTVTPYLVDHSAFDAYALLVEAGGRRLFYTGDLRAHGRRAGTFERLVNHPPKNVNVILMEGTRVGRSDEAIAEKDVERLAVGMFNKTPGMALAFYSVQNIDRLVSLYRAAKRSGRLLVLDLYGAAIVRATGNAKIPQPGWDGVRVFVPRSQRVRVMREEAFERVEAVRSSRIYPEHLGPMAGGLVLTFRHSMREDLERAGCLNGAGALWSMWPGYLEGPAGTDTRRWLIEKDIPLTIAHASGHASVADLRRLADAFTEARVVPIHTDEPDAFPAHFRRVEIHQDGERWAV